MNPFLYLRCLLRGGCHKDFILVSKIEDGWIDGMVPLRVYYGACPSCGKKHRMTTPRLPGM